MSRGSCGGWHLFWGMSRWDAGSGGGGGGSE